MLTIKGIDKAQPKDKPYKIADGGGLYLEVMPTGAKYWRLKYRVGGKEKRLGFGVYPEVRPPEARKKAQEARDLIRAGTDPSEQRKATKRAQEQARANTFEAVAREWLEGRKSRVEPAQHAKTLARLENDVFPWLGKRPIAEIDAPEILVVLRRIDGRGARYSAHRVRSEISRVFRFAVATGKAKGDPARDLIGAIPPPVEKHFASVTEPAKVAEMLRAFDAFTGTFPVLCALRLAPLLFVRPGELRSAEWSAIDVDKAEWRYRVSKTKTDHLVPLSTQAVAILRDLYALTGQGRYVFPGARTAARPMSDAAINAALRRLGYDTKEEITGHGFRAMARTILHEELHQKPEVIEHQLAHAVSDVLGTAYNRTKFLKERKTMMQQWADYLDKLKAGAEVIPLLGTAA
jgi:integrase